MTIKKKRGLFIAGITTAFTIALGLLTAPAGFGGIITDSFTEAEANPVSKGFDYAEDVPKWDGKTAYVKVNNNKPYFTRKQLKNRRSYESYGKLDKLGRCTKTIANIGTDLMPARQRGEIGMVKPTGWHTVKYKGIDGNYLYNRCHLIGYQLTGENANKRNLITGTRYLNIEGMLPFENLVADYLHQNRSNHVLYRVTPVFKGKELLARGVLMEGQSIEDNGRGVRFCVFCYNAQPDVTINYKNGSSEGPEFTGSSNSSRENDVKNEIMMVYVLNTNTKKFHLPSCQSVKDMSARNKATVRAKRSNLINQGYEPCGRCRP